MLLTRLPKWQSNSADLDSRFSVVWAIGVYADYGDYGLALTVSLSLSFSRLNWTELTGQNWQAY